MSSGYYKYHKDLPEHPMPGDAVRLTGCFTPAKPGDVGIIEGMIGQKRDEYNITFCASAFRQKYVSCSGGPGTIATPTGELIPTGETIQVCFWKWRDMPRANGGEEYTLEVPLWVWGGRD